MSKVIIDTFVSSAESTYLVARLGGCSDICSLTSEMAQAERYRDDVASRLGWCGP